MDHGRRLEPKSPDFLAFSSPTFGLTNLAKAN
jgi:hypothetical protein